MSYILANPILLLMAGLAVITLILAWFVFDLRRKWNRLFGQKKHSASDALGEVIQRLSRAEERLKALEPRVNVLEEIGKISIQKVGFLRFNPFTDTGGNQSFALALLDRENNGVVISSLYTREGVRVYAKRIEAGTSKNQLSKEEQQVLEEAMHEKL